MDQAELMVVEWMIFRDEVPDYNVSTRGGQENIRLPRMRVGSQIIPAHREAMPLAKDGGQMCASVNKIKNGNDIATR